MNDSRKLLEDYAKHGSEAAFRELVERYVGMVHSTALRLVNGDSHLAEDVTQTVFLNLARKAGTLAGEVIVGGWLHRNACFVASTVMRGERRRQNRERQAVEMNATEDHSAANFALVAPLLDEAINELGPEDRTAILLRFFEQQEFRAVGEIMGSNEDAARMRVSRALDKLHSMLKQRGVAFSAAALGTALAAEAVTAAPIGMAASVATAALGGAATGGLTLTIVKIMSMTKIKIAIAGAVAVAALATPIVVQHQTIQQLRQQTEELNQKVAEIAPLQKKLASAEEEAARQNKENQVLAEWLSAARRGGAGGGGGDVVAGGRRGAGPVILPGPQIRRGVAGFPGTPGMPSGVFPDQATGNMNACISNLRLMDGAKAQWALENHKQNTDTPTMDDIRMYVGQGLNGQIPVCPDGGVYILGTVGEKPTCSIAGHVLP